MMMRDLGLLLLRVGVGGMMLIAHGWGKLVNFPTLMHSFPNPIGLGSTVSLTFAVFAEVFCAFAVVMGLGTRLAAIPPAIVMATAAFVVHANDPWDRMEFALLYFFPFVAIAMIGGGRFAADTLLVKLKLKRQ